MQRTVARHPDAASTSRDVPPEEQFYNTLTEYLQLEHKFQPRLYLPVDSESEVSIGARDGAAHVLRCLKVWYDLPADVLIHAINLLDRFLTKMKVRPCHVPCITVSCMNIAIEEHAARNTEARRVSIEELVSVSQSTCTAGDVSRMSRVLVDKLGLTPGIEPVTLLSWLRAFRGGAVENELMNMAEIVSCDAACVNTRTCELALVLLYHRIESHLLSQPEPVTEDAYRLYDFAIEMQSLCNMSDASLARTRDIALQILTRYENRAAAPHRQRLVWRLSERTLKVLRPTDRLTSLLPTIQEQHHISDTHNTSRTRSGSESSENEETSDWPRSPVLPVYCEN